MKTLLDILAIEILAVLLWDDAEMEDCILSGNTNS